MCFVAFQRRFDANFMRLKQAVTGGEVGDVHMMHIVSRDPGPPPVAYIKVCVCVWLWFVACMYYVFLVGKTRFVHRVPEQSLFSSLSQRSPRLRLLCIGVLVVCIICMCRVYVCIAGRVQPVLGWL